MTPVPIGARVVLIGSFASGLALSSLFEPVTGARGMAAIMVAIALVGAAAWRMELPLGRQQAVCGLIGLVVLAGFAIGHARLAAIDSRALSAPIGERVTYSGYLEQPARGSDGDTRLHLSGPTGKVAVLTADPVEPRPVVGDLLRVEGSIEAPADYLHSHLARQGIGRVIRAEGIAIEGSRGGFQGMLDRVRERALRGMSAGMGPREAALAAGFVLGQDDAIDASTEEDFRRTGLAHLVAASGQNVMLLVLLGTVPLALAGVSLRRRVPILIALILIYLPLAGAGPSIQRAAVMGVVMLVLLWSGSAGPRLLALVVAAGLTLVANPRASGDVGWQLSFAATAGIMLLAPFLRQILLSSRVNGSAPRNGGSDALRRFLADGTAVTVAATLATAPLIAYHFGSLPVASLSANLLALPAVAPTMWLGMIAGLAGQIPAIPTEPINRLNALPISYIAAVASSISALPGAVLELGPLPVWLTVAVEAMLLASTWCLLRRLARTAARDAWGRGAALVLSLAVVVLAPVVASLAPAGLTGGVSGPPQGLRMVALDVGQGDAILIQASGHNLLVDTGPPGAGITRSLRRYGVEELEAVFITHADLDHVGGLDEIRAQFEIGRLFHADPLSSESETAAAMAVTPTIGSIPFLAAGRRLRVGEVEIEVLWPPAAGRVDPADRNSRSLVLLLRRGGFKALLTGDAEAEVADYSPGDIDLLKVAHHGSADRGLPALLTETTPELALISTGRDNRHGHPHPSTIQALGEAGVRVHRTDLDGDLILELP